MRSLGMRAIAVVVLASHFLAVPVAALCAAAHGAPASHCEGGMPVDGTVLTAAEDAAPGSPCGFANVCAAPGVALLGTAPASLRGGDVLAPPASAGLAAASYDSSPTSPPPQG